MDLKEDPRQPGEEPDPVRPVEYNMGWRVVVASLLLPIAWVVTESVAMTMVVGGFGGLLLLRYNPTFEELFEHDPIFRNLNYIVSAVVLLIFLASIVRNALQ